MTGISQVQKWREKQFEVLEVRRKLEESKHQAQLEKIQEENERLLKHRQQMKEKVEFCFSSKFPPKLNSAFLSYRNIILKRSRFI
jgi:hypothetical protein